MQDSSIRASAFVVTLMVAMVYPLLIQIAACSALETVLKSVGAGYRNSVWTAYDALSVCPLPPSLPITSNDWYQVGYLGCFIDSSTRDLTGPLYEGILTIDSCRTMCYTQGFQYLFLSLSPCLPPSLPFLLCFIYHVFQRVRFKEVIWGYERYAGMQYSSQCFCSNTYGLQGQGLASDCNMPCNKDSTEICGGPYPLIYI